MARNRADSLRSLSPVAPCPHMALWLDFSRNAISRCADSKITFSFFRWIHPCIDCLNPSVGPLVLCCVVLVTYEQFLFSSWTLILTFLCVLAVCGWTCSWPELSSCFALCVFVCCVWLLWSCVCLTVVVWCCHFGLLKLKGKRNHMGTAKSLLWTGLERATLGLWDLRSTDWATKAS